MLQSSFLVLEKKKTTRNTSLIILMKKQQLTHMRDGGENKRQIKYFNVSLFQGAVNRKEIEMKYAEQQFDNCSVSI